MPNLFFIIDMLIDTAMDLKMGLIKVVMGDFVSIYILVYKLHTSALPILDLFKI